MALYVFSYLNEEYGHRYLNRWRIYRKYVDAFAQPEDVFIAYFRLPKFIVILICDELREYLKPHSENKNAISSERKYCKEICDRFGVKGWTKLSPWGTAQGIIQGERGNVDEVAMWLQHQGSPGSRIEHCELRNWQILDKYDYRHFNVRF